MHRFIIIISAVAVLTTLAFGRDSSQPNVLLITADDLNWDSLGCTGNPLPGISPNLDRLAGESLLIENCHIITPICGPSREALYTGQLPHRSGYMGHGQQPPRWWKAQGRTPVKKSIASELQSAGYFTGVIGKHGSRWCRFSMSPHVKNHQTGMGRDPAKYFEFIRDFLAKSKKSNKPFYLAANTHDPHRYWARHPSETKSWFDASMKSKDWAALPNGKPYPDPKQDSASMDFVMPDAYPKDERFRKQLAYYFDSVNRMDWVVGEILRALDESGMADNTIVMFLSDHGLAWEMSKWSLYQSGTKTPLIVRWPGKIKAGMRNDQSVVSVVDIAPTLADLCGIPALRQIDGTTFRPLLEDKVSQWTRTSAYSCFNYMNNPPEFDAKLEAYTPELHKKLDQYRPSRSLATAKFTYVWNGWSDGENQLPRTMRSDFSNLLKKHAKNPQDKSYPDYAKHADFIHFRVPEELYDVTKDPGCLNNLANNPEYRAVMSKLRQEMAAVMKRTQDHELANFQATTRGSQ